ncbi:hypothetical protein [Reinekea sp.]|uniref:hypothetical protein n=1 Tax=Reinekea sp. TaxID=1970455 RepID=UPI002A7F3131|nr:hypothetical protein [Reinekea sp.]
MSLNQELFAKANVASEGVEGRFCDYRDGRYYQIASYDRMTTFFMSIVSADDHWLFLASNGGLTAGRQNAEKALFPYYSEDKIVDLAHCTGSLSLIREQDRLWQPFNSLELAPFSGQRSLYKGIRGDRVIFSEQLDELTFDYGWSFSEAFGLVKTSRLTNDSTRSRTLELLDGLQNILPANIASVTQNSHSVLLDAYKSTDLVDDRLALFYLSSRLTDLAEPSESLLTNSVWSCVSQGTWAFKVSLDGQAPQRFAQGTPLRYPERARGRRGSYFLEARVTLAPGETIEWFTLAEVSLDTSAVLALRQRMGDAQIAAQVLADIALGARKLASHLAKADGGQVGGQEATTVHHWANSLFNIMRGGFFEDGYRLTRDDLRNFVLTRNRNLADQTFWQTLPAQLLVTELDRYLPADAAPDLLRLVHEYLPISFSRRHGDPSRPWNRFSINLKDEQGRAIKDYQGNWRDIFQNWEPLALSYPEFLPAMISTFLNATTADGYNPYRVTRAGIEWETPEPENPWSNIGYWSDHQIIYLSKLLELQYKLKPAVVQDWFERKQFSYANVPYRIKSFAHLRLDPFNSIEFDAKLDARISALQASLGADAKLLLERGELERGGLEGGELEGHVSGEPRVIHVNLMEKLLTLWLAKLSNFVPGGGIWMNTQRPEWNDANNALVGWGLSVVTLAYLHRHLSAMHGQLAGLAGELSVSCEVFEWFDRVDRIFQTPFAIEDPQQRLTTLEALSRSGDHYRSQLYRAGFGGQCTTLSYGTVQDFLTRVLACLKDTLNYNQRPDRLYHGYNLLNLSAQGVAIDHLPIMLEGQVAVLASGLLAPAQSIELLQALRQSDLYRADQHTYLLYPNKQLPVFLAKNNIAGALFEQTSGAAELLARGQVFKRDSAGGLHFRAEVRNGVDLTQQLYRLGLAPEQQAGILALYEATFTHKAFTGRSGSFFAYEGLGSTYWHMVAKLLLAAQEGWMQAKYLGADPEQIQQLANAYYDIRSGIGFNKSPAHYGAVPTDPYSHSPENGVARQPGMTGQVKEELLTRLGEFGLFWSNQSIDIVPGLLKANEFIESPVPFNYLDPSGQWHSLSLPVGSLAFTLAQIPFLYYRHDSAELAMRVTMADGTVRQIAGGRLPVELFSDLCQRNNRIRLIEVDFPIDSLLVTE